MKRLIDGVLYDLTEEELVAFRAVQELAPKNRYTKAMCVRDMRTLYSEQGVEVRALLSDVVVKVVTAIEHEDYELAKYLINNYETVLGLTSFKQFYLGFIDRIGDEV